MEKNKVWTEVELKGVNASLEGKDPVEVLRWVVENFDTRDFALACSFGELTLLDMLVRMKKDARIFCIDTGLHFRETVELKKKVTKKYGIEIETYRPRLSLEEMERLYGPELWKRDPDRCCELRKVEPMREALKGLKVWITGLRRDESPSRANATVVGWDSKFGLIKVNPLACWTRRQVWNYIMKNNVPYNPLLDRGYPSIGCEPCTAPVKPGEDERAGRWAGSNKTECGLHK